MALIKPVAQYSGEFSVIQTGDTLDETVSWALTGDVTSAAGSGATTISDGVVTLPKLANLAAGTLIGNSTGAAGVPEAITIGAGLLLSGGILSATGGGSGGAALNVLNTGWFGIQGASGSSVYLELLNTSNSNTQPLYIVPRQYGAGLNAFGLGTDPASASADFATFYQNGTVTTTGGISIVSPNSGNTDFSVSKPSGASGNQARLLGKVGSASRWGIILGTSASETGSNAGSNFAIPRYDDTGAFLGNALTIERATGTVTIGNVGYSSLSSSYYAMVVGDRPNADGLAGILFNPDTVNNGMVLGFSKPADCMRLWDFGTTGGPVRMQIARTTGATTFYGEISSETSVSTDNSFRAVRGNYGVILRNDGNDFWILLTASGDPYGTWNALRPFNIDLVTGLVSIGNGLTVTGNVSADRFTAGFDSGVANSFNCTAWFRSSGNTGWYNQTYAGGWYMTDTTYVRSYSNKAVMSSDFVISSDIRLKHDINELAFRGKLRPVTYWMNGKYEIGFIAQDVEELYPELVKTLPETGMKHLSYNKLTAVLAVQINGIDDEVVKLRELVDTLEKEIYILKNTVGKLPTVRIKRKISSFLGDK